MAILRTTLIDSLPLHSAQYLVSMKTELLQSFQTGQIKSYFEFWGTNGDSISLISSQTV